MLPRLTQAVRRNGFLSGCTPAARQNAAHENAGFLSRCTQAARQNAAHQNAGFRSSKGYMQDACGNTRFLSRMFFEARFLSSKAAQPDQKYLQEQDNCSVLYMVNSLRMEPKDAVDVCNGFQIASISHANKIVKFLESFGFTRVDICNIVKKWPAILRANLDKNLKPKLEYFLTIGFNRGSLVDMMSIHPTILHRDLENTIIPCCKRLFELVDDDQLPKVISKAARGFKSIPEKIEFLEKQGLSKDNLGHLLQCCPAVLITSNEEISKHFCKAKAYGIDIKKRKFVRAVCTFIELSESTFEGKVNIYRRCGWTDSDVQLALKRFPTCVKYGKDKIINAMDFMIHEIGIDPSEIAKFPASIGYSLEKRTKPRLRVLKFLESWGLASMELALAKLIISDKEFEETYIQPYASQIPQLRNVYKGRTIKVTSHDTPLNSGVRFKSKQADKNKKKKLKKD